MSPSGSIRITRKPSPSLPTSRLSLEGVSGRDREGALHDAALVENRGAEAVAHERRGPYRQDGAARCSPPHDRRCRRKDLEISASVAISTSRQRDRPGAHGRRRASRHRRRRRRRAATAGSVLTVVRRRRARCRRTTRRSWRDRCRRRGSGEATAAARRSGDGVVGREREVDARHVGRGRADELMQHGLGPDGAGS